MIDTHTHLDGEEFNEDLAETIQRAKNANVQAVLLPAIDYASCQSVLKVANDYPGYAFPMLGLHPEEVRADWKEQLKLIRPMIDQGIAIGEIGLDYYWSREFEKEQLEAFKEMVKWSIETRLPLMIHCRKGQNEMVNILRKYKDKLPGGVFHCFAGNAIEARQLLEFSNFCLGIGGILTFKKSILPEVLKESVPIERVVIETDSPYMAPVPMRGKRNESAFVAYVLQRLAEVYGVSVEEADRITTANALRTFPKLKMS